jgi:hypothetical protein
MQISAKIHTRIKTLVGNIIFFYNQQIRYYPLLFESFAGLYL